MMSPKEINSVIDAATSTMAEIPLVICRLEDHNPIRKEMGRQGAYGVVVTIYQAGRMVDDGHLQVWGTVVVAIDSQNARTVGSTLAKNITMMMDGGKWVRGSAIPAGESTDATSSAGRLSRDQYLKGCGCHDDGHDDDCFRSIVDYVMSVNVRGDSPQCVAIRSTMRVNDDAGLDAVASSVASHIEQIRAAVSDDETAPTETADERTASVQKNIDERTDAYLNARNAEGEPPGYAVMADHSVIELGLIVKVFPTEREAVLLAYDTVRKISMEVESDILKLNVEASKKSKVAQALGRTRDGLKRRLDGGLA